MQFNANGAVFLCISLNRVPLEYMDTEVQAFNAIQPLCGWSCPIMLIE